MADSPFSPLPIEETTARSVTEFQELLLDWDTTPRDLRSDGEKSLIGFAKANHFTPSRAMKEMEKDNYKLARRQLSIEKGELNYKVRAILDVAYEQGLAGNKDGRRDYLSHYKAEIKPAIGDTTPNPDPEPEVPSNPQEMSDEQLEAWVAL